MRNISIGEQNQKGHCAQRQFNAWLSEAELASTLDKVKSFVMPPACTDALVDVANLMRVILTLNVPGDVVECGVWRGGTAFLMAELLKQAGVRDRKVWLFDSFEGMPPVEEIDGAYAIKEANDPESFLSPHKSRAPLEEVQRTASELGLANHTEFVKGWFNETLPLAPDRVGEIALLHIDCDWYSSVRCCLDNLYDRVAEGGFVFLDDYYHYDACTLPHMNFWPNVVCRIELRVLKAEHGEGVNISTLPGFVKGRRIGRRSTEECHNEDRQTSSVSGRPEKVRVEARGERA